MGNRGKSREAPGATRRFKELLCIGLVISNFVGMALLISATVGEILLRLSLRRSPSIWEGGFAGPFRDFP
jgi:hypothetical protein